jgi:predicted DNA-binding transcriptional regulator YafY
VRADRLLSMLLLLQARGRMSAGELARRLEVSRRTIYRDLEALNAAGVPVITEMGPHGGASLLPGWRTDLTGLTESELGALLAFASFDSIEVVDPPGVRRLLTEIGRRLVEQYR